MNIYPAIDLRRGRCVRLQQGERHAETQYSDDPLAMAQSFANAGARWIHAIDLDGAFAEAGGNRDIIKRIADAIDVKVQTGGGIRDLAAIAELLESGVARVILGTVAIRNPDLVEQAIQEFGAERIAIAIDARDGMVAVDGWETASELTAAAFAQSMQERGAEIAIATDISRDGMLTGVNIGFMQALMQACNLQLIASGGVASIDDVHRLAEIATPRLEGVILGKAMYEGHLRIEDALSVAGD